MKALLWVRRHAVMLGNTVTALVAMLSALVLHLTGAEMGATVALVAALASGAAAVGVVAADRLLPIAVGIVKAVLYLAVAFGAGAPWNEPGAQLTIVAFVEAVFGLWVVNSVTSAVQTVLPAPVVTDTVAAHFDPPAG